MAAGLSVREFARRVGVTHPAVLKAIKSGRITTNKDGTLDYAKASKAWERNRDPSKARGVPGVKRTLADAKVSASYAVSRAAREHFNARILEAEYKQLMGDLVPLEDVKKAAFDTGRRVRDLLLNVPVRVGPVVAGLSDVNDCIREIEKEIRRVVAELDESMGA